MSEYKNFILRFFDEAKAISPHSFSSKELGEIIIAFHDGIKELIDVRYPDVNSESINISLIGIENKSDSLIFSSPDIPAVENALIDYGRAISNNTYTDLPRSTYKSVKNIFSVTKKKNCSAELIEKGDRLFIVTPTDKLIKQENVLVKSKSEKIIYGFLNKIGGDKPKAWVELYDGARISFSITDDQLKSLRNRVKEPVALKGITTWSAISKKVVYFKLKKVIDYAPENIVESFQNIRNMNHGWDSLNNNQSILNFLKGEA